MLEIIQNFLESNNVTGTAGEALAALTAFAIVILVAVLANFLAKGIIVRGLQKLVSKSKTKWDDAIVNRKVFERLTHIVPALVIFTLGPATLEPYPFWAGFIGKAALIYMVFIGLLSVDAFLNAAHDIYSGYKVSRTVPIRSFIQVIKLVIYFLGTIFLLAILLNKSPGGLLTGLGALSAVMMLVFKDAILGFVAGIQLTTNRMVAPGDWIEMPKYGADGDVVEVSLTTVKIKNFDNTITTVPTYALISDSFKNWRGMSESGGRRIKRAIRIDMTTVKFCDTAMLDRYSKIQFISEYLAKKRSEVEKFNLETKIDNASLANGRRLTNLGTFRAYIEAYLRHHAQINQDLTLLVRQLAPTEQGLPIEIYVFCNDKRWVQYEGIQADIFDHLLAVLAEFDLRVFQVPSGIDMREGLNTGDSTR